MGCGGDWEEFGYSFDDADYYAVEDVHFGLLYQIEGKCKCPISNVECRMMVSLRDFLDKEIESVC